MTDNFKRDQKPLPGGEGPTVPTVTFGGWGFPRQRRTPIPTLPRGEGQIRSKPVVTGPKLPPAALCALFLSLAACTQPQPKPGFAAALPAPPPAPKLADGAIFDAGGGYAPLYTGHRAHAVGDPVTIMLTESMSTSKTAGSKSGRTGSIGVTPPVTGPLSFIQPSSLNASGTTSFKGNGSANQSSTLAGEVSVTIVEVRSNGTALVRGEKRLLLSQGEEWVQVTGIVRLSDIDADNRIASSRVADARIEYSGNGSVGRASREGWLSKFFSAVSPF